MYGASPLYKRIMPNYLGRRRTFLRARFEITTYEMRMAKMLCYVMLCLTSRFLGARFLIKFCEHLPVNTANINLRLHFTLQSLAYVIRKGLRSGAVLKTQQNKQASYGASPSAYRSQRSTRISNYNQHTFLYILIKRPPVSAPSLDHHRKPLSSTSLLYQGIWKKNHKPRMQGKK